MPAQTVYHAGKSTVDACGLDAVPHIRTGNLRLLADRKRKHGSP